MYFLLNQVIYLCSFILHKHLHTLNFRIKRKPNPSQSAPFAPLCFTVNARPPDGYIYYFAYGADMNPSRYYLFFFYDSIFWYDSYHKINEVWIFLKITLPVILFRRISTYIQRKVENRFWGLLFGFNLVFNKKGNLVWGLFSIHIYKII